LEYKLNNYSIKVKISPDKITGRRRGDFSGSYPGGDPRHFFRRRRVFGD